MDTSGAFNVAQTDQNTADLSCLAGVKEVPADPVDGINLAITYAVDNWPEMAGNSTTISWTTGTSSDGAGNEVYVDAAYKGDGSTMNVRVTEVSNSYFSIALGQDDIPVVQEANCFHQGTKGDGMLPTGALAGSWNGDLFDCAAKVTGNCGALSPAGGGANADRDAVAKTESYVTSSNTTGHRSLPIRTPAMPRSTATDPCNVSRTEPGKMVGPWNQGRTLRFDDPGADCAEAGWFNCESLGQVLGTAQTPLASAPAGTETALGWEDSIYSTFAQATASRRRHHLVR